MPESLRSSVHPLFKPGHPKDWITSDSPVHPKETHVQKIPDSQAMVGVHYPNQPSDLQTSLTTRFIPSGYD